MGWNTAGLKHCRPQTCHSSEWCCDFCDSLDQKLMKCPCRLRTLTHGHPIPVAFWLGAIDKLFNFMFKAFILWSFLRQTTSRSSKNRSIFQVQNGWKAVIQGSNQMLLGGNLAGLHFSAFFNSQNDFLSKLWASHLDGDLRKSQISSKHTLGFFSFLNAHLKISLILLNFKYLGTQNEKKRL